MVSKYRSTQNWKNAEYDVVNNGKYGYDFDGYLTPNGSVDWKRYHDDFHATWLSLFDVALIELGTPDCPVPQKEWNEFKDIVMNDDQIVYDYDCNPFPIVVDWLDNILPELVGESRNIRRK